MAVVVVVVVVVVLRVQVQVYVCACVNYGGYLLTSQVCACVLCGSPDIFVPGQTSQVQHSIFFWQAFLAAAEPNELLSSFLCMCGCGCTHFHARAFVPDWEVHARVESYACSSTIIEEF